MWEKLTIIVNTIGGAVLIGIVIVGALVFWDWLLNLIDRVKRNHYKKHIQSILYSYKNYLNPEDDAGAIAMLLLIIKGTEMGFSIDEYNFKHHLKEHMEMLENGEDW